MVRAAASAPLRPSWNGYELGARYTSPANGPKPRLYGIALKFIAIVRLVRPWYACSSTATPERPVYLRAILTPFSTASAPELTQHGLLREVAGGVLGEQFGDAHVLLVRRDREERVHDVAELPLRRRDDGVVGVADRRDADAGAEVDELVAVDVDDDGAVGALDDRPAERDETPADDAASRRSLQGHRLRSGDRGDDAPLLGRPGLAVGASVSVIMSEFYPGPAATPCGFRGERSEREESDEHRPSYCGFRRMDGQSRHRHERLPGRTAATTS